jgi:hypothetical protein
VCAQLCSICGCWSVARLAEAMHAVTMNSRCKACSSIVTWRGTQGGTQWLLLLLVVVVVRWQQASRGKVIGRVAEAMHPVTLG